MTALIQIVARLPPHVDGVGDYAMRVAQHMRDDHGIQSLFVACSPGESQDRLQDTFAVTVLKTRDTAALVHTLDRVAPAGPLRLVYHYSGYGYSPDGAPRWLVEGLMQFMQMRAGVRLATVFHELYATSMPWRRAFWYSPRQRRLGRQLAHMSDRGLCTIERNQRVLQRWRPELPLTRLAIASNIEAPQQQPAWRARTASMAVFGLATSRMRVYRQPAQLQALCRALGVANVVDIGPVLPDYPRIDGVQIDVRGVLPESQVSDALVHCRYGYLDYTSQTLAKSGVMAAYCAHGLVPVIPQAEKGDSYDGLELNRQYLSAAVPLPDTSGAHAMVAEQARAWYLQHNAAAHANWYSSLLRD